MLFRSGCKSLKIYKSVFDIDYTIIPLVCSKVISVTYMYLIFIVLLPPSKETFVTYHMICFSWLPPMRYIQTVEPLTWSCGINGEGWATPNN